MRCSTLSPKIHRKSMLPPRCSQPPCMNMLVNSVSQIGIGPGLLRDLDRLAVDRDRLGLGQVVAGGDLVRHGAVAVGELGALAAGAGALEQEEDERR